MMLMIQLKVIDCRWEKKLETNYIQNIRTQKGLKEKKQHTKPNQRIDRAL